MTISKQRGFKIAIFTCSQFYRSGVQIGICWVIILLYATLTGVNWPGGPTGLGVPEDSIRMSGTSSLLMATWLAWVSSEQTSLSVITLLTLMLASKSSCLKQWKWKLQNPWAPDSEVGVSIFCCIPFNKMSQRGIWIKDEMESKDLQSSLIHIFFLKLYRLWINQTSKYYAYLVESINLHNHTMLWHE